MPSGLLGRARISILATPNLFLMRFVDLKITYFWNSLAYIAYTYWCSDGLWVKKNQETSTCLKSSAKPAPAVDWT